MCDIWVLPHTCVNKAFVGGGGGPNTIWLGGSGSGAFGAAVQGAEAGRALDEIWSGKPDLFTRLNTAPSAGAPEGPTGTERAYFSAKTVQKYYWLFL